MIKIVIIITLMTGYASQYAPGVMDRVIRVRQSGRTSMDLPQKLPNVDGYVAVEACDRIGDIIYLRPEGYDEWEKFLIVDCSGHQETTAWMLRNNILVEVDAKTAQRWNTVGRGIKIEMKEMVSLLTFDFK
jgi:hypothetical protein